MREAHCKDVINTPNVIAAPQTQYFLLIILNAQQGKLTKENKGYYKLTLTYTHAATGVKWHSDPEKNGIWSLDEFIKRWNEHSVEANVTGIQTGKTIGHTQFYATFRLSNPIYNQRKQEVVFKAKLISPMMNNTVDDIVFDNATIYINGCDLCPCDRQHEIDINRVC